MTLHALTSLHDERDGTAHRFVLEVVQELEHVHRLADLAQRREARLHVGQHSQPTSRAGIVIAKLNLQCCCIGHHGHRVRFCGRETNKADQWYRGPELVVYFILVVKYKV